MNFKKTNEQLTTEEKNQLDIDKQAKNAFEEAQNIVNREAQKEYENSPSSNKTKKIFKIIENIIFLLIAIIVVAFTIFTIVNVDNSTVAKGVSILGLNVSGLSKSEALEKINTQISIALANDITLVHNDYETTISLEQLEVEFDTEGAVNSAFSASKGSNIFENSFKKLSLMVKPINITPEITLNEEILETAFSQISSQLPDSVIDSTYYIDENTLTITAGKYGVVVDEDSMANIMKDSIANLSYINNKIDIATIDKEPVLLNIDDVYNEIHKEAQDAYYTTDPYVVYPDETGIDFAISLDEAKQMLETEQDEYQIPLKVLYPSVTTNMLGMEAFPDLLASYSTKYTTSNKDRTTNLTLASNKINGTVILPGETFSYNTVVGERTIAAGYKEAAIYQDGQVVNGLGGGICQISSTLYNAVLYSNLEIVERRNHQFVPTYVSAGLDATVVYGSQDFKFKNNRNYAIKIVSSVSNGVATVNIYGLSEADDYEVELSASVTNRTSTYLNAVAYKTLKKNGQVISTTVLSKDTYKVH